VHTIFSALACTLRQSPGENCEIGNNGNNSAKLGISRGNGGEYTIGCPFRPWRGLLSNGRSVIFSAKWRVFSLFRTFRPGGGRLKFRLPSSPAKRSGHERAKRRRRCPDMGRQMGIFSHSRALRVAVMAWEHAFIWACARPCCRNAAFSWLYGSTEEIRRTIRSVCISPVRRRREMAVRNYRSLSIRRHAVCRRTLLAVSPDRKPP
jgi:hypothetical protein